MNQQLHTFMQGVLAITPNYNDIARAVPGFGVANIGAEVTDTMRKAAVSFAWAYGDDKIDELTINNLANKLEASLQATATVGVGSQSDISALLDDLDRLLQQRAGLS